MPHIIMFLPINNKNNILNNIILNVINSIKKKKIKFCFIKPIIEFKKKNIKKNKKKKKFIMTNNKILNLQYSEHLFFFKKKDILIKELISYYYKNIKKYNVFLIEGIYPINNNQNFIFINHEISKALNAKIIIPLYFNKFIKLIKIKKYINLIYNFFNYYINLKINGFIINNINTKKNIKIKNNKKFPIINHILLNFNLIKIRIIDIAYYIKSNIINKGKIFKNRIKHIFFYKKNIKYNFNFFYSNILIITSFNNIKSIFKICVYIFNGVNINSIILTNFNKSILNIKKNLNYALFLNLPIFIINKTNIQIFKKLINLNFKILNNDIKYIKKNYKNILNYINNNWIRKLKYPVKFKNFTPKEFIYKITELSKKVNKRIILPESYEPRILKAASICFEQNIAKCILLGNPNKIKKIALFNNIKLNKKIKIINPNKIRKNYIKKLIKLRKHKGMDEFKAYKALKDNTVLATMMLKNNEVDGLLSGSINTTANTIRPALQIIKTSPGISLISSFFFMLLSDKVLIFSDCAINIKPTAEQLSEIAIETAKSAKLFGIKPKIAMISYSTGNSGKGEDVEKIKKATNLVIKKKPNLIIDGPIQYDAAITPNVSKIKAPFSKTKGEANILIFPDLNTGNTTYKAVQRSTNIISIGPILQGIKKPVNDLSRGAFINDIIYTIAITSIQASKK
ncbi:MAG: phosphate acetyltransferase [Enterobacteriaceae bacterium PSpicST2]|nr:MAG: phosphate acetyltransferase [Enterobacteriaceae bacterium PSpicST2]WMC19008.1 MAG: phosphate acetyltransferase [Enterobacteriaceae bacterium PSpicST1]